MGKLCSKFREDRSTNNVTILSTAAGRTDVYVILYSVQWICIVLDRHKRCLIHNLRVEKNQGSGRIVKMFTNK